MSDELPSMVTTFMTKTEYDERRQRQDITGHVTLKHYTHYGGELYSEDDIGQIVFDAAAVLKIFQDDIDDAVLIENFDISDWSFELKLDVMQFVDRIWSPNSCHSSSEWHGSEDEARDFFTEFPDIKTAFLGLATKEE